MICKLAQHTQLAVGLKSGEHAACMMVVEQLASKLQIKFVAKLCNPVLNMAGLDFHIFLVVESVFHNGTQNYANSMD